MNKLKYFLDTEFIEYPNSIELISLGIKCEDGRKLYCLSCEYDFNKADEWVVENVIRPIYESYTQYDHPEINITNFHKYYGQRISYIKKEIMEFVGCPEYKKGKPEFWGYYSDYDWVVFCWIFGKMVDLPEGFPMYCLDLQQRIYNLTGYNKMSSPSGEHNALVDAEWNEKLYHHINDYEYELVRNVHNLL